MLKNNGQTGYFSVYFDSAEMLLSVFHYVVRFMPILRKATKSLLVKLLFIVSFFINDQI